MSSEVINFANEYFTKSWFLNSVYRNKKLLISIYVLLIIVLMLLPVNNADSAVNHIFILKLRGDYWLHVFLFLPWVLFNRIGQIIPSGLIWLLLGFWFAFVAEGLQFFLPYRAFNINDALSNMFGVAVGALLNLVSIKPVMK